ncbi:MAG: MurR/RpiR family transcriptional regulator [Desulfobacterales bacterium]|nr:MurR/RpiR family transcriptional regulator [Desulfobacterales bacterium]
MSSKQFIKRIQALDKLTPKEKKIADFFARNYDDLVFENLSSIGRKADVSKPTVLRFINKLGFARFAEFNRALRDEMNLTHDTLHIRYSLKKKLLQDSQEDILAQNFSNTIKNLETTYSRMDRAVFTEIARAIADVRGRLYIFGQRSSHALAYMFYNMIRRVLADIMLVPAGCSAEPDPLLDVTADDVLFVVFRHPYGTDAARLISYFRSCGGKVILLTDSELNPASDLADHQLVVNTEGVSVFTSSTSILAVLESLNIAVLGFADTDISERLERAESLYKAFGTFSG